MTQSIQKEQLSSRLEAPLLHAGNSMRRSLVHSWHRRLLATGLKKALNYSRAGDTERALFFLKRISALLPDSPWVSIKLALALERSGGDPRMSRQAIRHAARASRPTPGVLSRAAQFEFQWENTEAAEEILSLAASRFPDSWRVWESLGELHLRRGDAENAIKCFQRGLEHAPNLRIRLQGMTNVARANAECGRKDEAIRCYREIIETVPTAAHAYYALIQAVDSTGECADLIESMRELLGSWEIGDDERQCLHFALGVFHDRRQCAAEAFAHFHLANELRARKIPPSSIETRRNDVERRIQVFDKSRIANLSKGGCRDHTPICIVGMPCSGATLVEQIVSSHSCVAPLGDRNDISVLIRALPWELGGRRPYPDCVELMSCRDVARLAGIIAKRRQHDADSSRFTTHVSSDFWDLGLIYTLFPEVKIIHCRRHPIDTCLSCYMRYMQNMDRVPFVARLQQLAGTYFLYERMMEHWQNVLPSSAIRDVCYETLLESPGQTINELCDFCGLEFEEACLQFHRNSRRVSEASLWQVRMPLYATSVNRWERYRDFLRPLLPLERLATVRKTPSDPSAKAIDPPFADLLIALATDPRRLDQFRCNPDLALAGTQLTDVQARALKSRDVASINYAATSVIPVTLRRTSTAVKGEERQCPDL